MMGCGLLLGSPYRYFGSIQQQRPECASWPHRLRQVATSGGVDVVMILVGRWETMDRMHHGKWRHLGDPSFDDYVRGELQRARRAGREPTPAERDRITQCVAIVKAVQD